MSSHLAPPDLDSIHAPIRVLIIPGLHNSGPGHWQTWLQGQYEGALRVQQQDWHQPELTAWSDRIAQTLARHDPRTEWIAVAHSFGCLALAHHLGQRKAMADRIHGGQVPHPTVPIRAALMVAPASPDKFGIRHLLPQEELGLPATLVGSDTDPWMQAMEARAWAQRWGLDYASLGDAGHINVESGHGPWPLARYKVDQMIRHLQQQRRLARTHPLAFSCAV
jgi:predicted alpha/beta hydrolase family esterase